MRGRKQAAELNAAFLDALRQTGIVTHAAEVCGLSRAAMYLRRDADPTFAAQWDAAVAEACDRLEAEAWRRAVVGVEELVVGRVGKDRDGLLTTTVDGEERPLTIRKHSDALLALLLKAHKPEKYRERTEAKVTVDGAVKAYVGISPDEWDSSPPTK